MLTGRMAGGGRDIGGEVLVCLDKFRDSISATDACAAVVAGIQAAAPDQTVRSCPVADGGEGTALALIRAGYSRVDVRVTGPIGQPVDAILAVREEMAVVELAQAAGRHLAAGRAPLAASTFGVGQMVRAGLDLGYREIVLAVGGSATTDGGAGMLRALGARFSDRRGRDLAPGGGDLARLARVDLSGLDRRLEEFPIALVSDVSNPLLGREGAAAIFAPQKGATTADIARLEVGLACFAEAMESATGLRAAFLPGAGAAGGTGFAVLVLGGKMRPGVRFVLDHTGISNLLPGARLIIVGEGSMDTQSLKGKAPIGIARLAQQHAVPVVAVAGQVRVTRAELAAAGISAAYAIVDVAVDIHQAITEAPRFLQVIGRRIAEDYLALSPPGLEAAP